MKHSLIVLVFCAIGIGCGNAFPTARAAPEMVLQIGHSQEMEDLAWSHDGKMAASVAYDGLKLWTRDGTLIRAIASPKSGSSESGGKLAFSPDDKTLFYSTKDLNAYIYSISDGRLLKTTYGVEYSAGGTLLIKREENAITFLDARSGKLRGRIKSSQTANIQFSPDGRRVVLGGSGAYGNHGDGKLRVWEIVTGKLLATLNNQNGAQNESAVRAPVAWSPDGKTLATAGNDVNYKMASGVHPYALQFWDARNGKSLGLWRGNNATHLRYLDARRLFNGASVWDVRNGKRLAEIGSTYEYGNASVSPDRKLLLATSTGLRAIIQTDLATGKVTHRFAVAAASGFSFYSWSRDGKILAGGGGAPNLWDARTGNLRRVLPGTTYTQHINFLPNDGVSASNLQWAYFWNAQRKLMSQWPPVGDTQILGRDYSSGMSVSPGGQYFLTKGNISIGEERDTLHIWTGERPKTLHHHRFQRNLSRQSVLD